MAGSRNQSTLEYFDSLQLEWIVYSIRQKVYRRQKDKEYYGKIMAVKEETIKDIASNNILPSIFSKKELMKIARSKVVKEWGFPDFHYDTISPKRKDFFQRNDQTNYYNSGSAFRFFINSKIEVGTLKSMDKKFQSGIAILKDSGREVEVKSEEMARIL